MLLTPAASRVVEVHSRLPSTRAAAGINWVECACRCLCDCAKVRNCPSRPNHTRCSMHVRPFSALQL